MVTSFVRPIEIKLRPLIRLFWPDFVRVITVMKE